MTFLNTNVLEHVTIPFFSPFPLISRCFTLCCYISTNYLPFFFPQETTTNILFQFHRCCQILSSDIGLIKPRTIVLHVQLGLKFTVSFPGSLHAPNLLCFL